jgi:hypothetical protein
MPTALHAPDSRHKGQKTHITNLSDRDTWIDQLLQVEACELSGAAKVVATCIALNLNLETGRCHRSSGQLAIECGLDERSVRRRVQKLESSGWIGVDHSGGRWPNSFWLRTPPDVALSIVGGRDNGLLE